VSADRNTSLGGFIGFPTQQQQQPGYFDNVQPQFCERSTVGSASATGSVGGRTTWASSSDVYDADKMSEDDGVSSVGGLSDEGNASLVGFGEGASSTTSGPISGLSGSSARPAGGRQSGVNSPVMGKASAIPPYMHQSTGSTGSANNSMPASTSLSSSPTSASEHYSQQRRDSRLIDGMTYDPDIVDTAARSPQSTTYARNARQTGAETAERIMRERAVHGNAERDADASRDAGDSPRPNRAWRDGREGTGGFYQQEER
jgi:hypothetical protein